MKPRDALDLVLLAALWGASFLFMRLAVPAFGPVALAFVRVAGAAALLLPWVLLRGQGHALRQDWQLLGLVGLVNSAAPFLLYALASLVLATGLLAVLNATAPLWAALIGWLFWRDRLGASRWVGLGLGLAGVVGLSWGKGSLQPVADSISPTVGLLACAGATLLYGVAANLTRHRLASSPPLVVAAGSQLGAMLLLAAPAWWWWPVHPPAASAWAAAIALALLCTALAYVLYFRLIARVGPSRAISVTFLIPVFAMLWGYVALQEVPTLAMLAGCGVILLGTGLATGVLRRP
jgi:drug/metabolite transporter (DMT)-like permease